MAPTFPRWQIASRIAAASLGSYAFAWGGMVLAVAAGLRLGMDYGDALTLAGLGVFLVFLVSFLWAFAATSVLRVWVALAGGGLAMMAVAWWLRRVPG